ncbi:HAAS signaling domain-containing protein [Anaerosporobacter faecicola]|uniref:HAAS signaling domain-containing protein n=1 Tax=Anaerosporobacter faecicola TaxID=2718714 RepID=UPI001439C425|nr:DUF1700 domain-containing protein [Anaerosporobacter faecicola]
MSKEEFIKELRESLYTEVSSLEIENNVRYYSQYIDNQVKSGKTIEQVMYELGDPRLIARTIIETSKLGKGTTHSSADYSYQNDYKESVNSYSDNEDGYQHSYTFNGKLPLRYRILAIVFVILFVILLVFLGTIAIRLFITIGIPLLLVYFVYRLITNR